ncbi:hypothetical protein vBYenPRambo_033 [Yersinia phage vB_YenP_Rambo]|uniref:Uncharacterized protein n=1 Tax=Yersinia phage vB_YenP_Rambo TaxID=2880894 RepID=A0AC61TNV5_9CAUD|nr:hypothetical protein vBYenPRambo_033 [Yersinia phage vB_YenP_Rambo]
MHEVASTVAASTEEVSITEPKKTTRKSRKAADTE